MVFTETSNFNRSAFFVLYVHHFAAIVRFYAAFFWQNRPNDAILDAFADRQNTNLG